LPGKRKSQQQEDQTCEETLHVYCRRQ
jgi:hypothetical protein